MSKTANITDLQIAICGSAGDGTIAAGDIFRQAMAKLGYNIISFDLYPPEIRGFGKCVARVRCTSEKVYAMKPKLDVLISLDDSHAIPHTSEVGDYGSVIYENSPITQPAEGSHISSHLAASHLPYGVPFREMSERATNAAKSRNIVAIGYLAGLFRIPPEHFHESIAAKFRSKAKEITLSNQTAFDTGYQAGLATLSLGFSALYPLPGRDIKAKLEMMDGNTATVKGCLDAGIATFFGYPITPATSIMEMLAREMPRVGGRMLQTEDEISAVGAAVGAGYAGVRTATATSGPGLALMTELLGLATMAEIPLVVFVSQRGGPSTGMPTKTEQSDLGLAVFGFAGDAQRVVLAPTNVEGCYMCAGKAFEIAETCQTPVIVLLDLYLSNRYEAVRLPQPPPFQLSCNKDVTKVDKSVPYQRYQITDDWISPRAIPGERGCRYVSTGLEHNEAGRPGDSAEIHTLMSKKRHAKLAAALEHPDITIYKRFGDDGKVDVGLLCWGSTFGEALEAMFDARKGGIRCSVMKVVMLSPLPVDAVNEFMDDCGEVLVPELNYVGQFANLISGQTGRPVNRLNCVPGAPIEVSKILEEIHRLVNQIRIPDRDQKAKGAA